MMITAMWWAGTGLALLIGLGIGFALENATHEQHGRHYAARGAPSDTRDPAPPPAEDPMPAPLTAYDPSRIAMLDGLTPGQLLDLAIFISGRHPDAVDEGLALLVPIDEDPAR